MLAIQIVRGAREVQDSAKMPKKNLSGQYYIKDGPENRFWSLFIVLFRPDPKRGRAELSNGVSVAIWRQKLTSPGLVTFDKVKIGAQLGTIGVKLLNSQTEHVSLLHTHAT